VFDWGSITHKNHGILLVEAITTVHTLLLLLLLFLFVMNTRIMFLNSLLKLFVEINAAITEI
jgi:hypothetical protein